ncbi:NUDIX hydrolase [Ectobacillus ponti]|uniref:NUDIX domain-containing protein n=1 Tax=Ectobacillus ponti TaxID=2961894 RepID=A0AA42BN82_9BACI|nr:NUDIX domain-containing protein [Ectobacillus ponti]MCP8967392.1 NUDIX domain-containing protein [Ectobacillus ponti]
MRKHWKGAAAVCIQEGKLLMVRQGAPGETPLWTVPSGGIEPGETPEECCIREVQEETGYTVAVVEKIREKQGVYGEWHAHVDYFTVELIGGCMVIQDPDNLIYEIAWKSAAELQNFPLSFPEDREFLLARLSNWK